MVFKRIINTLHLFLIFSTVITAQFNFLPITVDYAIFHSPSGKFYIEIYTGSLQKNFIYQETDEGYQASYEVLVTIYKNDSLIIQDSQKRHNVISDPGEIVATRLFVNTFVFELPAGQYEATVRMRDSHSGKEGKYSLSLNTGISNTDEFELSRIQLAGAIKKDAAHSEFSKNGYFILPNPGREYHATQPMLYYYAEIYNMQPSGQYALQPIIEDINSDFVKEYPVKFYPKPGNSSVNVSAINLIGFHSGDFRFRLIASDPDLNVSDTSQIVFRYFNPRRPPMPQQLDSTNQRPVIQNLDIAEYAAWSEKELDNYFEKLKYKLNDNAINIFSSIDKIEKIRFIAAFWKENDPTPDTEENEFKQEYHQRLDYAERQFSTRGKNGWKTDRGRILLTYGEPDEVEKHQMEMDKKPYEIWIYHKLQGGVIFIFANLRDFGEYELVHSDMRNELYQPNWEQLIQRTRTGGFNQDQY